LFLSVGFVIEVLTINTPSLVADNLKTLLGVLSYSASFGYWLGLSFTSKNPARDSLFFSSLFGTLTVSLAVIIYLTGNIVFLILFAFAVLSPLLLIKSQVIEQERFKFFKKAISVFSEHVSLLVTIYYFSSWYLSRFEDALTANIMGVIVSFIGLISYLWFMEKLKSEESPWTP